MCVIRQNSHVKVMQHINTVQFATPAKTTTCCTCIGSNTANNWLRQ